MQRLCPIVLACLALAPLTPAQTCPVLDEVAPGSETSPVKPFHAVGAEYLLFSGRQSNANRDELFRWDATNGPQLVLEIDPAPFGGSAPADFCTFPVGGQLRTVFSADDGVNGRELWITDGTGPGTQLLADIAVGPGNSNPSEMTYVPSTGLVVFTANAGVAAGGGELYVTDGTGPGTGLLADILPGPSGSGPLGLLAVNGEVIFSATGPNIGRELYRTDGSPGGTSLITELVPGPGGIVP